MLCAITLARGHLRYGGALQNVEHTYNMMGHPEGISRSDSTHSNILLGATRHAGA